MVEDVYKEKVIPARTIIIPNMWCVRCISFLTLCSEMYSRAMSRDEEFYPDSHIFNPDRFLDKEVEAMADEENKIVNKVDTLNPDDLNSIIFGFG